MAGKENGKGYLAGASVEFVASMLKDANIIYSHCRRCRDHTERFGVYPFSSGLMGEVLDVASTIKTKAQMEGLDDVAKRADEQMDHCGRGECEEGVKCAEELAALMKSYADKYNETRKEKRKDQSGMQ